MSEEICWAGEETETRAAETRNERDNQVESMFCYYAPPLREH